MVSSGIYSKESLIELEDARHRAARPIRDGAASALLRDPALVARRSVPAWTCPRRGIASGASAAPDWTRDDKLDAPVNNDWMRFSRSNIVRLLLIGFVAVAIAVAYRFHVADSSAMRSVRSLDGRPAPDFAVKTADGQSITRRSLLGHVAVVDFWATWCPPCRASLPHIQELAADPKLAAQGVKVLAVNAQEDAPTVQAFLKKNDYTFKAPLDPDGAMMEAFHADSLPTTLVIDRGGIVRKITIGYDPADGGKTIRDAINAALAEKQGK